MKLEIENIYSLRLDFGFSDEDLINLVKEDKFIIELNASTLTKKRLDYLKHNGVDLKNYVCHIISIQNQKQDLHLKKLRKLMKC